MSPAPANFVKPDQYAAPGTRMSLLIPCNLQPLKRGKKVVLDGLDPLGGTRAPCKFRR